MTFRIPVTKRQQMIFLFYEMVSSKTLSRYKIYQFISAQITGIKASENKIHETNSPNLPYRMIATITYLKSLNLLLRIPRPPSLQIS